jgi:hypothetical protein
MAAGWLQSWPAEALPYLEVSNNQANTVPIKQEMNFHCWDICSGSSLLKAVWLMGRAFKEA